METTAPTNPIPTIVKFLIGGAIIVTTIAFWPRQTPPPQVVGKTGIELGSTIPQSERVKAFDQTVKAGAGQAATWPATEEQVVRAFWGRIIVGDLEGAVLYSPGTTVKDLQPYKMYRPKGVVSIGAAQAPNPANGTTMIPVTIEFPGIGNKQLGMAMIKLPDGRLAIHGGHSIWW